MAKKDDNTKPTLPLGTEDFYLFPQEKKIKSGDEWVIDEEGQLSVDVFEDDKYIYIESTIAGVKADNLDIYINNDMITIRCKRERETEEQTATYHFRECYWGSFSRSIVLPTHVKTDEAEANLKNGILKIVLPKAVNTTSIKVNEIPE